MRGKLLIITGIVAHLIFALLVFALIATHGGILLIPFLAIAAGEALRLAGTNQVVNTYIAMQGAVPSEAYDLAVPWRTPLPGNLPPDFYASYYTNNAPCYFAGVAGAGAYINFYATNDYFLTNGWASDQNNKPALRLVPGYGYRWDGTSFLKGVFGSSPLLFPTNTYEIFSYCDPARCQAIGAQPNLGGPFDPTLQIDLTTLPSGSLFSDHNAEFESSSSFEWGFWHAVLRSMLLKH